MQAAYVENDESSFRPAFSGEVDDLRIGVRVGPIDGSDGTWAQGSYCNKRYMGQSQEDGLPPPYVPSYGAIEIDAQDLANVESLGLFDQLMAHEIGYVLGIGIDNTWMSGIVGSGTTDPRLAWPGLAPSVSGGHGEDPVVFRSSPVVEKGLARGTGAIQCSEPSL